MAFPSAGLRNAHERRHARLTARRGPQPRRRNALLTAPTYIGPGMRREDLPSAANDHGARSPPFSSSDSSVSGDDQVNEVALGFACGAVPPPMQPENPE